MALVAGPDPSRLPLSLRYGPGRFRDAAVALMVASLLTAVGSVAYHQQVADVSLAQLGVAWAAAWGLVLLPVAARRWGRRVRIDDQGVTVMQPRGVVRAELRWEEVDGFAAAGRDGLTLHGAGRTVQIGDEIERAADVWPRVRARCEERILDGLRAAEEVVLPVPASRLAAHGTYLLITGLLAAETAFALWSWWRGVLRAEVGVALHLAVWTWVLWSWRREAAWLGGWVRVDRRGLTLKKLDGTRIVPWADVAGLRATTSGWRLERKGGRAIAVHAGLVNLLPLERLVRERVEGASGAGAGG
jgi:hypothetical protein